MKKSINNSLHGVYSFLLLVLFICLFYIILIEPVLNKRNSNFERIENLTFQINRLDSTELKIKNVTNEIKQLKLTNFENKGFLEKNTPAIAAANLQKNFKELIKNNGGHLVSTHVVKQTNDDIYEKVTIKTHIKANIETLRNVLYTLTTNNPILFIENILIQKRSTNRKTQQNNDLLEIRFDISGFIDNIN